MRRGGSETAREQGNGCPFIVCLKNGKFNLTIQEEDFGVKKPGSDDRYLSLINDYLKYYNNSRLPLGLGLKALAQFMS